MLPQGRQWSRSVRFLRQLPESPLVGAGLGLSLLWEVLQSPFYTDTFTVAWPRLLFDRLHCTAGDTVILLVAFWLVALRWGRDWMQRGGWAAGVVFAALGVVYTFMSEHWNVHLVARWAYSPWMPTLGGAGLAPLLQWVIVPMLCIYVARRKTREQEGRQ